MPAEWVPELPGVLVGSPAQIASTLQRYRAELGLSFITVPEAHAETFTEVITLLR
jgi:alkanesulfonate monooxygenase SsuD/methylene tetrahydromethanopterin reductase-like flavin-dependent oxidoreductase (luciferase family)